MLTTEDHNASYRLIGRELITLGYKMEEYSLGGRRVVSFTGLGGGVWLTPISNLAYPLNSPYVSNISTNKTLAGEFIRKQGVSTAHTVTLGAGESIDLETANKLFARYDKLIVKPEAGSLSRGLTLGIKTHNELKTAIVRARRAKSASPNVLIQEQIYGEEIRFVVLGGKVVAALLRRTPRVVGDGRSTVKQLIDHENAMRSEIKNTMVKYPQLDESMIKIKRREMNRIPELDEVVELSRSTMIMGGCSVYNVLHKIHESYVQTVEDLVRELGAGFIVADMMIRDYKSPQTEDNAYFNEFNMAPVLKLFYSCRDGKNYDIVPELVRAIDKRIDPNEAR